MAIACLFVACKVDEVPRPLDHVLKEAWRQRVIYYGATSEQTHTAALARLTVPVRHFH